MSEVTAFHEAVPGHHFQITIAQELTHLPLFRRVMNPNAYAEGWGLYTERLADEMGLYSGDVYRLGMLAMDSMRAGRLVVDTGMHAKGWSREQAVDYLRENTPMSNLDIGNEIDRYIAYPGQALSYMVGRLEIQRLRAAAEQTLGDRFDIRAFHDVVLGNGSLPLAVLDEVVTSWVAPSHALHARPSVGTGPGRRVRQPAFTVFRISWDTEASRASGRRAAGQVVDDRQHGDALRLALGLQEHADHRDLALGRLAVRLGDLRRDLRGHRHRGLAVDLRSRSAADVDPRVLAVVGRGERLREVRQWWPGRGPRRLALYVPARREGADVVGALAVVDPVVGVAGEVDAQPALARRRRRLPVRRDLVGQPGVRRVVDRDPVVVAAAARGGRRSDGWPPTATSSAPRSTCPARPPGRLSLRFTSTIATTAPMMITIATRLRIIGSFDRFGGGGGGP